ncbi:hypothetical protein STSP2_03104 [Anaerohalosphaera lusitana]|uniref:DUF1015 domain-containing protein n=1 Tax=Anaerohalosphaera lusitana TaxID=1936003 RepID=A0A1U9NQ95_9BACT|nr:DUF1015 domain-containing protein [Anaerohalosphaera lusitana]AQT69904.1 hypothetical protein STSP2_03104 [Anaerohalosphaera lusitana]
MEIKAFKGLRFNPDVVGDAGSCISPPYDVIDEDMQQALYDANPYNIVRVIQGKKSSEDSSDNNQYTRAAEFLKDAQQEQALKQDEKDTIYAYVQDFEINGQQQTRSGFVALGKIEDFGSGVKAHEKTLDGPKADRLNLMRATAAQFGQIFMLFNDPEKVADKIMEKAAQGAPLLSFTDDMNVVHKLFAIDDPADVEAVKNMMGDKQAIIADGHHRYETALNYWKETQNPDAQYRMMTFVNMHNEGLVIQPTHRLVMNMPEFDVEKLVEQLKDDFAVVQFNFNSDEAKQLARKKMFEQMNKAFENEKAALGIYAASGSFYVVTLKDFASMNDFADMSDAAKKLDVNVLHNLILDRAMGIDDAALAKQSNLKYIKDIGDAIERSIDAVDSGQSQVVFFMNPTRIEQVNAVAMAGEKMPQKSTFFHPKVFTGLVINKL